MLDVRRQFSEPGSLLLLYRSSSLVPSTLPSHCLLGSSYCYVSNMYLSSKSQHHQLQTCLLYHFQIFYTSILKLPQLAFFFKLKSSSRLHFLPLNHPDQSRSHKVGSSVCCLHTTINSVTKLLIWITTIPFSFCFQYYLNLPQHFHSSVQGDNDRLTNLPTTLLL